MGRLDFFCRRPKMAVMRRFVIGLVGSLFLSLAVHAGEGKVIKVLPQYLDQKGRTCLSPSLYERDAYQFHLRKAPKLRGGARLAIQWKARDVNWTNLTLRAEVRCLLGDKLQNKTFEQPAVKHGHYSTWSEFRIEGDDYKNFGEIVAWRVTLLEGGHELGQMESFLWSNVDTVDKRVFEK